MKISSSQKLKNLLKIEKSIPTSHTTGGVTTTTWFLPNTKKYHRKNGPAFESTNGHKEYWVNGVKHREGEPAVILPDGHEEYWENGIKHREGAPAVILPDGHKEYYENGLLHRLDGPAVIKANGEKKYYIDGHEIPEYDYMKIINREYGKSF